MSHLESALRTWERENSYGVPLEMWLVCPTMQLFKVLLEGWPVCSLKYSLKILQMLYRDLLISVLLRLDLLAFARCLCPFEVHCLNLCSWRFFDAGLKLWAKQQIRGKPPLKNFTECLLNCVHRGASAKYIDLCLLFQPLLLPSCSAGAWSLLLLHRRSVDQISIFQ